MTDSRTCQIAPGSDVSSFVAAEGGAGSQSPRYFTAVVCLSALAAMLIAELVILTLPFNARVSFADDSLGGAALIFCQRGIRPAFVTGIVALMFLNWPTLRREFYRALHESQGKIISTRWIGIHLLIAGVLFFGTRSQGVYLNSIVDWALWLLLWLVLAVASFVTLLFGALPPRFWRSWLSQSRSALTVAASAGLGAYMLGNWMQHLWLPLQRSTLLTVVALLKLAGQAVVVQPEQLIVGTTSFQVAIAPRCSGLEGIGLICVFIAIYFWVCRRQLRFPRAFLLLPIGALSVWLLNSVRIATLILIGKWSAGAALKGFHSVAGWIFFNSVCAGLLWLGSRSGAFGKIPSGASRAAELRSFSL